MENEDTEIVEQDKEWIPPTPKTENEKLYARLAIFWKTRHDSKDRQLGIVSSQNEKLKKDTERLEEERDLEHQEAVSLIGDSKQMGNEIDGLLRRETNVDKRVTANLESLLASVRKVEDALSGKRDRSWFRIGWEFVAVATVLLVALYEPFRAVVFTNIAWIVMGGAVIGYFAFRANKTRKGK